MGKRGNGEVTIYQRADGRWTARLTLGDGKRKDFYGGTRKEVADKLKAAQGELQRGVPVTTGGETLQQFLDRWLVDVAAQRGRRGS